MQTHVEFGRFAGQLSLSVVVGKGERKCFLLVRAHPDQLLGETGRRLRTVGIDNVLRVFAVQHRPGLAIDCSLQVDTNTVAKLHGAFDGRPLRIRVA